MKKRTQIIVSLVAIIAISVLFIVTYNPYDQAPDIAGFIQTQPTQLIIKSNENTETYETANASITITTEANKNNFMLSSGTHIYNINIESGSYIQFASKQELENTVVVIKIPNAETYNVPVQSSSQIQKLKLLDPNHEITKTIKQQYENQKQAYLIQQIGGEVMLHPVINKIVAKTLQRGNTYRPKKFSDNLTHYIAFQENLGFGYITQTEMPVYLHDQFQKDISTQFQKGFKQTKISERLQNIFKKK